MGYSCMTQIEKDYLEEVLDNAIKDRERHKWEFETEVGLYLNVDVPEQKKIIELVKKVHDDIIKDLKRIKGDIDKLPECI